MNTLSVTPMRGSPVAQGVLAARALGVCLQFEEIRGSVDIWMGRRHGSLGWEPLGARTDYWDIPLSALAGRLGSQKRGDSPTTLPFDGKLRLQNFYAFETPSFVAPDHLLLPREYLKSGITGVLDCLDNQGNPSAWAFRFFLSGEALEIRIG